MNKNKAGLKESICIDKEDLLNLFKKHDEFIKEMEDDLSCGYDRISIFTVEIIDEELVKFRTKYEKLC